MAILAYHGTYEPQTGLERAYTLRGRALPVDGLS